MRDMYKFTFQPIFGMCSKLTHVSCWWRYGRDSVQNERDCVFNQYSLFTLISISFFSSLRIASVLVIWSLNIFFVRHSTFLLSIQRNFIFFTLIYSKKSQKKVKKESQEMEVKWERERDTKSHFQFMTTNICQFDVIFLPCMVAFRLFGTGYEALKHFVSNDGTKKKNSNWNTFI